MAGRHHRRATPAYRRIDLPRIPLFVNQPDEYIVGISVLLAVRLSGRHVPFEKERRGRGSHPIRRREPEMGNHATGLPHGLPRSLPRNTER